MKTFAIAALAGIALGNIDSKFMEYIANHGKSYGTVEEYKFRLAQFAALDDIVEEHNSQNGSSYTLGHNQFSDWTHAEYKRLLGYKPLAFPEEREQLAATNEAVPDSVDWRTKGAVTPVKDQGQCGSCWSFSSTGAMEGVNFNKTKELISFSEQQLVDCVTLCFGCNGGNFTVVYNKYAKKNAMYEEKDWPYKAANGNCSQDTPSAQPTAFKTQGSQAVTPNSVSALKEALIVSPVSVAIQADQKSFQTYKSGVFDGECGTSLDHAVLLVGYGSDAGKDYWIMKNSWNTVWGDAGYMKMVINGDGPGQCGVMMDPVQPY